MKLMRFDPFRELEEMSSRLNRVFGQPAMPRAESEDVAFFTDWAPAIDVQETDTEFLVKADLPEVKKEDIKIGIERGVLTVEGERKQEKEEQNKKFHRIERSYGKFVRRLSLPTGVDDQHVTAEFREGVLNVHVPKAASAKTGAIGVPIA